jgi:hypothetical protein
VGSRCQREQRKEKERERGGPARGELGGPAGLAGPKGERVRFFFFFKLLFKTAFLFKFKSKLFQTFSQKFINLLETTQATDDAQSLVVSKFIKLCLIF